MQIGEENWCRH